MLAIYRCFPLKLLLLDPKKDMEETVLKGNPTWLLRTPPQKVFNVVWLQ